MKRRLLSLFLAFVTILSLLPTAAFAASSEEDALGEVDIYNGDYELGYLAINGAVKKQKYTYFLYESNDGSTKESPAYCVNPNQYGVPQTVGPGESIKYLANEKASDPKVVGIISNGYPHRSLGELGLENKYQAFYATKMALWCYLIPSWDISNLKVAPGLSGDELDRGNRILAAAKDIYKRGTTYNYMLTPRMTVTADKSTAYPVTIGGQEYKQQVFTVWSETWVYNYDVSLAFSDPDSVPEGTKIVDTNNNEITAVTTKYTSDGYAGTFKVLYPADSVEGQSGNVQLSLSAPVAQYAAMYAVCQEKDQYGDLQNYHPSEEGSATLPNLPPVDTRKELADSVGLGERTMGKVMQIDEHAPAAVKEALDKKELSIHQGYQITKQVENLPEGQREQAALEAVELAKAKKEIQEKDAEIDREGKIAGVFCKAYEKAVLLDPTEENVRIWAKCTRMTRDEMEDTVKESRELAEVFRTIADLMERFLPDRGTL